jgi:autotransporter translocation and assembly factor TamB
MPRFRPLHLTAALLRALVYGTAVILLLIVVVMVAVETGWVKERIRRVIVDQANHYLTATLDIGRLQGSIFRGLTLGDVRLTQNGETIISIDEVSVSYSIKELVEPGLIIRRIRLTRPHVAAARLADGRWNLSALVRRERREQERSGPGRPLHIQAIEVVDGDVIFHDPLSFDAVHVPTRFASLQAALSFDYEPVTWKVKIDNVAWAGDAENITMNRLTGGLADGPQGWEFDDLAVATPGSTFTVNGTVVRETHPSTLNLHVDAPRFAFQEWRSVLNGLRNIAVQSSFRLALTGPTNRLAADIDLHSDSGDVLASLSLDTAVPGWHGKGNATVTRLDLSHWLNRPDRPSNITGRTIFDIDLDLGRHFPRGAFTFDGPHVAYLGYDISNFKARGTLTDTDALIADATGVAYGSDLHITTGSIGIDEPYTYRFVGSDAGMNLTKLPPEVPLTHVDSRLAIDAFDVNGQFGSPAFIRGNARFGASEYLGAAIGPGTIGSIDTSATPVVYSGEGDVSGLDMGHFGEALDVLWMQDPRWAGVIAGHFHVDGAGSGAESMKIDGGGHLTRADMFDGRLLDADVSLHIAGGSLTGSYSGELSNINTEKAFDDPRFAGTLTGRTTASFAVRDLLVRTTELADYTVDGTLEVSKSTLRGLAIDTGAVRATLTGTTLNIASLNMTGPVDGSGSGVLEFDGERPSDFHYQVSSGDLALADAATGQQLSGTITTDGSFSGPMTAAHVVGNASVDNASLGDASVLSTVAQYDITASWDDPAQASGRVTGTATEIYALGQDISSATGTIAYKDSRLDTNVTVHTRPDPRAFFSSVVINGSALLHPSARNIDLLRLSLAPGGGPAWQLAVAATPPRISWSDEGFNTPPLDFADAATGSQHLLLSGNWRTDGTGTLRLTAQNVSIDALTGEPGRPAPYGGTLNLDASLSGTRSRPIAAAHLDIADGRVQKIPYQRFGGRIDYDGKQVSLDVRLDQNPGVWLTAKGTVPVGREPAAAATPIDLAIESSTIGLGLLEGATDLVHDVAGELEMNVKVAGTTREPHVTGHVSVYDAAFTVSSTGGRYKNGRATLDLSSDRINVSAFHLEDRSGRTLDVNGSLGTRALALGDIQIDANARHFEILHNNTGSVDVDARLTLRGDLDAPALSGDVTILSGDVKVDEIFERALFQPYSTAAAAPVTPGGAENTGESAGPSETDTAPLGLWDRLALDITVHSPGTLRMIGQNVQVAQGTPLGLGSFNLHATGDVYLYKGAGQPVYISGSFDSISGSYSFQGRRFDVDPVSSVNFRGDFNPELYVSVSRTITGVQTHVTITGTLHQPELQLSSNPPLESSDILSLIVFNTSTTELSASQQQDLAVRAGTLAYGFVATPLISALQRSLGLDTLEIAPPSTSASGVAYGPMVTVGDELVPGLVAQFSRSFGQEGYDQAALEYYISRILRLRATFSDAQSLVILDQPFQRIERAGIDLLFFFSF